MDVREKLVELLKQTEINKINGHTALAETCFTPNVFENMANKLISHGVTVQEWDGCEYCEEYEDLPEHFVNGKPVGRVFDTCIQSDENGLWHLEVPSGVDIGIRFCPMCGRRLPQPPKGE